MILLIPVAALFMGAVTVASYCANMAGAECGGKDKAPDKCMTAASHQGCGGCGQTCSKGETGKSRQRTKGGPGCCVDCPLCYLVTIKPFFKWESARQVTLIEYTVMADNNLSDYFQRHWKPPST